MFSSPSNHKLLLRLSWIVLFFAPILSSCASNKNTEVEMVYPPIFPDKFSSIPSHSDDPNLQALLTANEMIKDISIGRKDPFLSPQLKGGNTISVPKTFKYHGQIASKDIINAFVSFEKRTGTIKPGDIGGESTDLLPKGWLVSEVNNDTKALILSYEGLDLIIDLFSNQKK